MKVLIISDTHRKHRNFDIIMERLGKIDLLIHLGDAEGGEDYIEATTDCPVYTVAGNNDFFSDLDKEEEFFIGKYRVFICHGHRYGVNMGTERIKDEGRERKADIVMFGHTHRPLLDIQEDITILNPGSLSYPRQEGRRASYMIMELDRQGEAHFSLNYV